jgi:hypothetical protein
VGGLALLVMKLIKMIPGSWTLRVSRDGELEGLDLHEHGTAAYHVEFGQGMTYSAPPNLSPRNGAKEPVVTQVETIDPESSPVGPESSPV